MGSSNQVDGAGEIIGVTIAAVVGFSFCAAASVSTIKASHYEENKKHETFSDKEEWDDYFENPENTEKFEEDKKQWDEYVRNNPDVGVITLAYIHSNEHNVFMERCIKILLFFIPIVQIAISITVFNSQLNEYNGGICPANGSTRTKFLGFCIGVLYIIKVDFLLCQKFYFADTGGTIVNKSKTGGKLQYFVLADQFMNIDFEFAIYLFNLWIVFKTTDPLDMVLNALALEFIMQFDDEVKRLYLDVYKVTDTTIKDFMKANGGPGEREVPTGQGAQEERKSHAYRAYELFAFFPIVIILPITLGALVHFGAIVIPVCKPTDVI